MRNATLQTSAAAILLLIVAACGGGAAATQRPAGATTPAQPTAAGVPTSAPLPTTAAATTGAVSGADACSLLTVDEVSAAYGDTLDTAKPTSDDQYSYCDYGADREVRIYVAKAPGASQQVFDTMTINDGEAVSGVGDAAYWSTDSFAPGLYFLKNGGLAIHFGLSDGPEAPIVALGVLLANRM